MITDWIKKRLAYIVTGLVVVLLSGIFIGGCQYGKSRVQYPPSTSHTEYVYDTSWHRTVDSLNHVVDSLKNLPQPSPEVVYLPGEVVPVPADVDTAAILRRYYTTYRYKWFYPVDSTRWSDKDDIHVRLLTTITENRPIAYDFSYQWLKPQQVTTTTVDNSVTYDRYVTLGVDVPIKNIDYTQLEATLQTERWYAGVGYIPKLDNTVTVRVGGTLFKFKKKFDNIAK